MKIAIVGTGYVGLVTGTCLAEIDAGNIICVDIDDIKINNLKKGISPIYENRPIERTRLNTRIVCFFFDKKKLL